MNTSRLLQPADLARLRAETPGVKLLDVRTPAEFETQVAGFADGQAMTYSSPCESAHADLDPVTGID